MNRCKGRRDEAATTGAAAGQLAISGNNSVLPGARARPGKTVAGFPGGIAILGRAPSPSIPICATRPRRDSSLRRTPGENRAVVQRLARLEREPASGQLARLREESGQGSSPEIADVRRSRTVSTNAVPARDRRSSHSRPIVVSALTTTTHRGHFGCTLFTTGLDGSYWKFVTTTSAGLAWPLFPFLLNCQNACQRLRWNV